MAYCNYDFYKNEYYGNLIAEADFPRLAERASEIIDVNTFGRLEDGMPEDQIVEKKVKKAVCALAEKMADVEVANQTVRNSGGSGISSVSSGSESISFKATDASVSDMEQQALYRQIITRYLTGTGLLYAGI